MPKDLYSLFFCVLLILVFDHYSVTWSLSSDSKLKTCPEEKMTLNGAFEWKLNYEDGVSYVISEPDVCWENDEIVLRQCDFETGEWFPNQVQCRKFESKNLKCPDDLIELIINNEYLCLKISAMKQAFDEHFCYGSNYIIGYNRDSLDNEILKFLLEKFQISSFWMPVKRYEETAFNPFVIRLPGEHWNELFVYRGELLSASSEIFSDKHCIVSFIKKDAESLKHAGLQIDVCHCTEVHYSVCVTKKHFVAKSGCAQGFGALSHKPNECYGITWGSQKYPEDFRMLSVTEYFKKANTINIIYEEFDIINDKYVEVGGAIVIPNKKWTVKPKKNHIKIFSSEKKVYGICTKYVESRKNVEMLLRMDPDIDSLILTVYNKIYIWSNENPENAICCFTNADYDELSKVEVRKIWENDSQTKTIFKLKIKNDDPGQYWCEAHTIFNFSHVTTQKVIAAKTTKGHAYAMRVEVPLKNHNVPLSFTPDQMKHMAVCIKKDMKNIRKNHKHFNELAIHNVRVMDIIYIHPNASYLECLCHTTVSMKSSTVDTSKEQNEDDDSSIEDGEGVGHDTAVRMRARDLLIDLMHEFQSHLAHTVLSTEFCFPENEWLLARIGESATNSKLCLQRNGLPITRKCLGSFVAGAYWDELQLKECIDITKSNVITSSLYSIEKKIIFENQPEKNVRSVRKLLESNSKNLVPADLHYLAKIMRRCIKSILKGRYKPSARETPPNTLGALSDYTVQKTTITQDLSEATVEIVRIFNFLLDVSERVIRPSIALNSTNILLDTFEYLMDHVSLLEMFTENATNTAAQDLIQESNTEIEVIEYLDVGVVAKIATNCLIFIIDPLVANVTGIALFRADLGSGEGFNGDGKLNGAFRNEYYRFILANQSVEELLNEQNILLGTYVPSSLWQRLDEVSTLSNGTWKTQRPEPKVVMKVYANSKLFQEKNLTSAKVVGGKVVSISIPGHDKDLPEMLPLILTISKNVPVDLDELENNNDAAPQKQLCSYWNYQAWATDGVAIINRSRLNNNTVLCGCTHLTPFAYLIGGSYNLSVDSDIEVISKKMHKQALDLITIWGCSLSLFGIAGIFVTACTFRSWRKKANSKVLLQLSAAIALQMILFCFVNTEENSLHLINQQIYTSCIAIGACLHYSVLVQFCWMVIIAYLQFKRYVQVFGSMRPTSFFMKSTILGWGLPLIPVACVLLFDSDSYIPQQKRSSNPLCYPSGISFYIGIVLPITIVITANLVIFVIIICSILKNPVGAIRHTDKRLALSQIRLLVLLFFLLGFTWIFGLLNAMKAGLVFSYLFCLTATLQGFILFVYFIVMDPETRRMWHGYFAKLCGIKLKLENSSSVKEVTESF